MLASLLEDALGSRHQNSTDGLITMARAMPGSDAAQCASSPLACISIRC